MLEEELESFHNLIRDFRQGGLCCTSQKVEPAPTAPAATTPPPEAPETPAEQTAEAPKEEEKKEEVLKLGDTVKFDGLHVTLNSARIASGNDFFKPKNGQYVVVDVTVENTSDKPQAVHVTANEITG